MELWIRSQGKGLAKIVEIEEPNFFENGRAGLYGCSACGNRIFLGAYQTEERAIEVLDEIQAEINKFDGDVYEMPKE